MSELHYNTLHKIVTDYGIMANQDGYHAGLSEDKQNINISPIMTEKDTSDGWKFHLSIKPEDLPKAWDTILEDIVKSGASAQVATPDHSELLNMEAPINSPEQGRMITLQGNDPQKMMELVQTIEEKLIEEGIQPSQPALNANAVEGSKFISYSNEGPTRSFWESAPKDPFKNLAIDTNKTHSGGNDMSNGANYKEKYHAASRVRGAFQDGNVPNTHRVTLDEGAEGEKDPSVRVYCNSKEEALAMQAHLAERTGLPVQYADKNNGDKEQYMAIVLMDNPEKINQTVNTYNEETAIKRERMQRSRDEGHKESRG